MNLPDTSMPSTYSRKISFALLVAMTLLAAGVSFGGPCVSDTAADYQLLGAGGCTIGVGSTTLLFNNFTFTQNASGVFAGGSATQINLAPIFTANTAGFDITPIGTFNAGVTGVNDIELVYVASVVGGANLITGLNASLTGSAGASNVGGGSPGKDFLLEDLCRGGSLPPGSCPASQGGTIVPTLTITGAASGVITTNSQALAATNALSILKDLNLGGNNGGASVTDLQNIIVLTIPEPSMSLGVALALCGLIAFGKFRSRRS
jgi:hypothetical protein